MEIALSTVIDAARLRLGAVTAEAAGYVVLLAVQQVVGAPRRVGSESVFLSDAGDVRVQGSVAGAHEAELDLRQLLASLVALSQSTPPALKAAAERVAGGGLGGLASELLAALIPLNHAAARRALARLYREAQKARVSGAPLTSGTPATSEPVAALATPSPAASDPAWVATLDAVEHPDGEHPVADFSPRPEEDDLNIDVDVMNDDVEPAAVAEILLPSSPVRSSRPVLLPFEPAELAQFSISDPGVVLQESTELQESDIEEYTGHRSDLRELLAGFLSHTRCEQRMTEDLRRMIGVEARPARISTIPPLRAEFGGQAPQQ